MNSGKFEDIFFSIFCSLSPMLEGGSLSESPVCSSVSLTLPLVLLEGLSTHPSFDEMFYGNEGLWWSLASLLAPSWVSIFQVLPVGDEPGCQQSGGALGRGRRCLSLLSLYFFIVKYTQSKMYGSVAVNILILVHNHPHPWFPQLSHHHNLKL